MHIAYYLTSHGFGHSVRACAVIERLSPDIRVTLRTDVPEEFFLRELDRPFIRLPGAFDCGCLQHDSVTASVKETMAAYAGIASRNAERLEEQVRWCRDNHVDTIVSDIPSFPLEVAARAGIPSAAVANFTWYDVYGEYLAPGSPHTDMVRRMREQYATAAVLLEVAPALPMPYFARRDPVGIVGRTGNDISAGLRAELGIEPTRRLALLYLGSFGMEMEWERLRRFPEWAFLTADPVETGVPNLYLFDRRSLPYRDVAASVDAVVGKLGYGVYATCLLHGVSLLYLPRAQFAEYPVLERAVESWGGAARLNERDFRALRWRAALDGIARRGRLPAVPDTGARLCAEAIERLALDAR